MPLKTILDYCCFKGLFMVATHRRDDAVLLIAQDNTARRVNIVAANAQAQTLLGYADTILEGKPLQMVLTERLADLIAEYVEFEPDGNDVATVLSRARDFQVMNHVGSAQSFMPKFIPVQSDGAGRLLFQMMLHPSEAAISVGAELRNAMNIVAQPTDTDVQPRQHMLQQIESWQDVASNARAASCLVLLVPDQMGEVLEWHGEKGAQHMLHEIMQRLRQTLRQYDTAMALPRAVALVLLDAQPEATHMVLNRLRWELASLPLQLPSVGTLSITLSAAYAPLDAYHSGEAQLTALEQCVLDAHKEGKYNQIFAAKELA
jgi:GGDEF domain-containing protein